MYIPYGKQEVTQDDIDAVIETLKSDFLTQGPKVVEFENKIKKYCNSDHSVAFNSATSALHAACFSLELGPGDYLWTSPITFVASANCALYCGANIDFVDINPKTFNMCESKLEAKLKQAEKEGKLPKIVIPVHLAGQSCNMKAIYDLSQKYGFKIIEDASHAIGGKYLNENIGNCKYSDITIFSFHPVKIITTGEGGMALTNNSEINITLKNFRTHGITREERLMKNNIHGSWYYEQINLGFNYRISDIQAALGISQLNRLDSYVQKRHKIAKKYDELFKNNSNIFHQKQMSECYSAYHLYIINLDTMNLKINHKDVFEELRKRQIGVNIHYIPVHLHPYYKDLGFKKGDLPQSEDYYSKAISLPIFPTITENEQDMVVNSLNEIINC